MQNTNEKWNGTCRCGHDYNSHGKSHSINYTAGICEKCECKNFCMLPVQEEGAFSAEKHAEWMKTNGWEVEFTKFFYGEWDNKRDTMKDFISKTISQEREKWLKELADDFDFRCELAEAVMEQYNKVPKTGSFYFDGISSQEVMWQVIEKLNLLQNK